MLSFLAICAGAAEPKRVLLINSFGREFAPFDTFAGYFRAELIRQSPEPLDIYEVSLESARLPELQQEGPLVNYLQSMFGEHPLDLVVPIGGPAVRFAQTHRSQLFPAIPMLLAAVDQRHLRTAMLTTNDTVMAVRNDPVLLVEGILHLLPQTTNVAVVIGDSRLEQFWLEELEREYQRFRNRISFVWLNELSFTEMLEHCAALPPRSAIFYAVLAVDAKGVPHIEDRALAELYQRANAPIFGLHDTQLGRGIVGGRLMAIGDLSRNAAGVAARLLRGATPGDIRLPPQEPGLPQFDWRELRRWGISEARLPPERTVRYRQATLWDLHKRKILAVGLLCLLEAVLIILLLANLVRRRRAERSLRESEDRLKVAAAAGDVGVWAWDPVSDHVWASENWRRIFGFATTAVLRLETVWERIHRDDRETVQCELQRAVENQTDYAGEFRVALPDGTQRWIAARGRLDAGGNGQRSRMMGAAVDVTERKNAEETARELSGRLIKAQECERARLARELHDDITQRLARLAIDAARVERGTTETGLSGTMREVREGLVRLSEDIHALSYRLHPAMLEDLGLAAALKAECERFSRQESIPTEVKLVDLPAAIPHDAALCLFRITQEALRNVARHARASAVELTLRPLDTGLQLAVRDNGIGIDPAQRREQRSLGLASMQERTRLLAGELDIESSPGHGTTVIVWLPMKPQPK